LERYVNEVPVSNRAIEAIGTVEPPTEIESISTIYVSLHEARHGQPVSADNNAIPPHRNEWRYSC
jgi:hypothetical protein